GFFAHRRRNRRYSREIIAGRLVVSCWDMPNRHAPDAVHDFVEPGEVAVEGGGRRPRAEFGCEIALQLREGATAIDARPGGGSHAGEGKTDREAIDAKRDAVVLDDAPDYRAVVMAHYRDGRRIAA